MDFFLINDADNDDDDDNDAYNANDGDGDAKYIARSHLLSPFQHCFLHLSVCVQVPPPHPQVQVAASQDYHEHFSKSPLGTPQK